MPRVSPRYTGPIFQWTDAPSAALRAAWNTGLSTAKIADLLSKRFTATITKNMVIGRANRLGLPPRTSPIASTAKPAAPRAPRASRLRPSVEIVREPSSGQGQGARIIQTLAPVVDAPVPAAFIAAPRRSGEGCKYPLWGDGRPDHRYCDAPRAGSSSYCGTHHRLCNVRPITLTEAQREAYAERANIMRAHKTHNDGRGKLFASTRLAGEIWG
jgi:hypothetical protein